MIDEKILQRTIIKSADRKQMHKASAECAELIVALNIYLESPCAETLDHVLVEMVDVIIGLAQLKRIFKMFYGASFIEDMLKEWEEKKFKRMQEAL